MPDFEIGYETIGTLALFSHPNIAHGTGRRCLERAMDRFSTLGVEVDVFQCLNDHDLRRQATRALNDDYDAVAVCGGDSMINVVLQEVARTDMPIGIIPCGPGPDHARQFRIPRTPELAAEIIVDGFTTTSDLGRITTADGTQRWFGSIMCLGFDAEVARHANAYRWAPSRARFNLAMASALRYFTPSHYRIELKGVRDIPYLDEECRRRRRAYDGGREPDADGTLVIDRDMTLVAFGNTRSYGDGVLICPRADYHDGLLDVTVVEKCDRLSTIRLTARHVRQGTLLEQPLVSSYRVKSAHVTGPSPDTAYADGQEILPVPFDVEAVPAAARFIVPAP